jgi:hypothetical protein
LEKDSEGAVVLYYQNSHSLLLTAQLLVLYGSLGGAKRPIETRLTTTEGWLRISLANSSIFLRASFADLHELKMRSVAT